MTETPAAPMALVDHVRELARTATGWSDEEYQYQLRKKRKVNASLVEVRRARAELKRTAT